LTFNFEPLVGTNCYKKITVNNELISHLRVVSNESFIGLCIQHIVKKEQELQEMLDELKTLTRDHPEIMVQILGKEASRLLIH
jgi:hypothetical protein